MLYNEENILVLDKKGKDITKNIVEITEFKVKAKYQNNLYTYNKNNLQILTNPIVLEDCLIKTNSKTLSNVIKALKFQNYIKIFFENGTNKIYHASELTINEDLLKQEDFQKFLNYLKEMASHLTIADITQNEQEDKNNKFLSNIYKKINFINPESVLKEYVRGVNPTNSNNINLRYIYPFSFNLSQKEAVKNAFTKSISIIEGPPGTGKTQTILNIISNAIINKKTVAVLSNNNSATDNVFEKLEKQNLGSICAKLGKQKNITEFILNQAKLEEYPQSWCLSDYEIQELTNGLFKMNDDIEIYLKEKNEIAKEQQELDELKLEQKYFNENIDKGKLENIILPPFDSNKTKEFLLYLNKKDNKKDTFNKKVQIMSQIRFKFKNKELYNNNINEILDKLELTYYETKKQELENSIKKRKERIKDLKQEELFDKYTQDSMKILKHFIYKNYNKKKIYNEKNIKCTQTFIKDYPVILSTTYSLLNCIDPSFMFDYIIVDESSQVDLVSSTPALNLAKNIIIVGDSKQLPNIIDNKKLKRYNEIFERYNLDEKYNYTKNSLLEFTKSIENITSPIILKEHYRCHPKIISFCNKKFYDNELIILSSNNNDEPLKQYRSVKGNHARSRNNSQFNDRQAQIIKEEVIPEQNINIDKDSIGIITPYKEQKEYLKNIFKNDNLAIDTVHGFQGREKEIIIFSTVANNITKFLDNPNSINVAISRAINKLFLVTPYEYESDDNSNISNLISYIKYNNFEIIDSKVNSIFDLLYKVNEKDKINYLKKCIPFSKYISETLMYNTILEILKIDRYKTYGVKDKNYPLRKLIKDQSILNKEELQFINRNSHVDFLIYNKFDKKPILAIEVDGYKYHNKKEQIIRDKKKESILQKCNIPLLRVKTNESKEKEKLIEKLDKIIKQNKIK